MNFQYDVIVVGAGIAGMTSSIYLTRAGKNVLLLESFIPGGQMNRAFMIENYPGFEKIEGSSLSSSIFKQVKSLEVEYARTTVQKIEIENDLKRVICKNGKTYTSKFIIIATGRKPRTLDIPNVKDFEGKGLSYCATCDGRFFKEKNVIVVGGSNSSLEEAMYLSSLCNEVTILNRSKNLRAEVIYQDQIKDISNIKVMYDAKLEQLNMEDDKIVSCLIDVSGKKKKLSIDGCFSSIGYVPNINFNLENLKLDDDGYIVVSGECETSVSCVYAVGDIVKKDSFQLITAMNDAVIATNSIVKRLK